ncbi:MAG: biopolymer transporter ExbD [Verrucomicrobia bacterium]|nr:MAG: biopolymer transporter ExbD [Verrucomicrobiota bacterium]
MKLEMHLSERPNLLHAVPIINLFALLAFFYLLGPSIVFQSGVAVELPPSQFQMQRYQDTQVITLGPGRPMPKLHFGRDPVSLEQLVARLEQLKANDGVGRTMVLLQADANAPISAEREIAEMVLNLGFRVGLVGQQTSGAATRAPAPPSQR